MIVGNITPRLEIVVPIHLWDSAGKEQAVEAMLDTGFNGALTLPPATIASLGLPWISRSIATLADGSVQHLEVYGALLNWDGIQRTVLVQAIDATPLLGMALLVGYDLRARVLVGGLVEIQSVP